MFSVIVATYNRENTLKKSLESILRQSGVDVEIVVVDDGSEDTTEEVVRSCNDARIRFFKLEKNQGASVARNRGIQEARGEYILVWDSDDVLHTDALSKINSVFEKDSTCMIVSAPARVFSGDTEVLFPPFPEGEVTLSDILCKTLPSNEKVRVAKASVMKQVSYVSRNIDFLVNVALVEKGKWFHLQEFLGDIFNDPTQGSLTALRRKRNAQRSIERAPYLNTFLEKHGELLKKTCAPRYADYCYGAGIGFLLMGDVKNARWLAHEAVRYHRWMPAYWGLYLLSCIPLGSRILGLLY